MNEENAMPEDEQNSPEEGQPDAGEKDAGAAVHFPKTPEGLRQEKRDVQNFGMSGNSANMQWFNQVINIGNDAQPYKEVLGSLKARKGERFDLEKPEECAKFIEEYRNGEYLALAIILAVFSNINPLGFIFL